MQRRAALVVIAAVVVTAVGAVGIAMASDDEEKYPINPEDAVTGPVNTAPGSASEYWTDERKRNATGG
ncbi:hypothetical protein [Actinophytocola sp. NPDC049390]|uniref:hypothetical protein n=1 Tax=Actinophytocola sp. NPDC049390 TaxID=3363894 RepID=UPI0037B29FD7